MQRPEKMKKFPKFFSYGLFEKIMSEPSLKLKEEENPYEYGLLDKRINQILNRIIKIATNEYSRLSS